MGIFLLGFMALGVLAGLLLDALLLGVGTLVIAGIARRRRNVWPVAGAGIVIGTLLVIAAVALLPYENVRPGSDYDVLAYNLLVQSFGYTASAGIGVIAAIAAALFCPPRTDNAAGCLATT